MDFEAACHRLCDDIERVLFDKTRPAGLHLAYAAGRATHDLASAFHHAAGHPEDRRWSDAIESIERFLDVCDETRVARTPELSELRTFVAENLDARASAATRFLAA